MGNHNLKAATRTIILILSALILAGCATDGKKTQMSGNQNVMFAAETQQAKHGLGVDDNLEAIRQDLTKALVVKTRPDHYLALHFAPTQNQLNTNQKADLATLVKKLNAPKTYSALIYAGPGNDKDGVKAALSADSRAKAVRTQLRRKLAKIQTFYDPKLPVGLVIVQMIAGSKTT